MLPTQLIFSTPSTGGLFAGAAAGLFGSGAASSGGFFSQGSVSGGGGSGSTSASIGTTAHANAQDDNAADDEYVAEEEVTTVPGWTPSVSLEVNDHIDLGEDDEEELYSQRSRLYRFRDGDWKERGTGDSKLLKHKETGKVRFMMRQEKTLKIS